MRSWFEKNIFSPRVWKMAKGITSQDPHLESIFISELILPGVAKELLIFRRYKSGSFFTAERTTRALSEYASKYLKNDQYNKIINTLVELKIQSIRSIRFSSLTDSAYHTIAVYDKQLQEVLTLMGQSPSEDYVNFRKYLGDLHDKVFEDDELS